MEAKQLYEEKGQVETTTGAIVTLITGVGVAVLVIIFMGALSGQTWQLVESTVETLTTNVANDTKTMLNSTVVSLENENIISGSMGVTNATGTVIPNAQFDFDLLRGTFTLNNNTYNNTAGLFTYEHGQPGIESSIKTGVIAGFNALNLTGTYLPIIVLAIVIFLVLVLVLGLGVLTGGRAGGGSSVL